MNSNITPEEHLRAENAELRVRLEEAEETLRAIRSGEVDALVVETADGPQVFMLQGHDAESNHFRGEILSQVSDSVIAVDAEDRITFFNTSAARQYRVTADAVLGRKLSEIFTWRWTSPEAETATWNALRENGEWHGEITHRTHDGREFVSETSIAIVRGASGSPAGYVSVFRDITERMQTEAALRSSEIRYRRLFESAKDGILILDGQTGQITDANPYILDVLGSTRAEVLGREPWEIGVFADATASRAAMAELQERGYVRYENLPLEGKTGLRREVEVVANVYQENGDRVIQCNVRDITQRKATELALRLSEEFTRRVLDNLFAFVGVLTPDGILMEANRSPLAAAGILASEVIGKPFWDAYWWSYSPEVQARVRSECERAARGETIRRDVPVRLAGGEVSWIDYQIAPLRDSEGRITHLIPSAMDISDRKLIAEKLRQSEEKFRVMADGLPSLIWVHDAEGNLLFVNRAYSDFYRLADGELLGDRWQNLVHPDDYDRYTAEFVKATEKRSLFHAEARVRSDVGEWRWIESWGQPRFSNEGQFLGYVGNSVDVTARKHNEALLEQAHVDLEIARKQAQAGSQAKSEFLANMSHEIRTPMTAILGYAELLNGLDLPSEANDYLKTILRNGDYLLEIINDILDLSKIEAGKLELNRELFDPVRVVEDVRSFMNLRAVQKDLQLNVRYDGKLPRQIESDPKRLKQILVNLVGNAIKFTKKGQVDIVVRFDSGIGFQSVQNNLKNHRLKVYPTLMFDIIDTGIGMSDVQKSRLFKRFTQGDSSVSRHFGGTGLGLDISRRLAKMLGGNIRAESKLGEGSKFRVTIGTGSVDGVELVDPNVFIETPTPAITALVDESLLACSVLVVDDRRDIRFLSRRILSKAGATVDEAEDGQLALDFIRNRLVEGNPPALILLDMQMPNLDGYETAKRMRASGFVGPIIALTADTMQGDMNRCLEAGCNDYLSKPIDAALLVQLVREMTG